MTPLPDCQTARLPDECQTGPEIIIQSSGSPATSTNHAWFLLVPQVASRESIYLIVCDLHEHAETVTRLLAVSRAGSQQAPKSTCQQRPAYAMQHAVPQCAAEHRRALPSVIFRVLV